MITLEEAQEIILKNTKIKGKEIISLFSAKGRILAEDVYSPIDQPPFPRSPLDGYAVLGEDLKDASRENPKKLKLIDKIYAGNIPKHTVQSGEAVRIMTGAPIPADANCIVRQEDTKEEEGYVKVFVTHKPYENYCFQGEDLKNGTRILCKNIKLNSSEIMALSAMGFSKISVYKKPVVGILTVGDELQNPGSPLTEGKIYNSNCSFLYVRLMELGAEPRVYDVVKDDIYTISKVIEEARRDCDLIVSTGGVSVGEKDFVKESVKACGYDICFWKVAIKPGSPMFVGVKEGDMLIGLSGNPVAAATSFELTVRPCIAKMLQCEDVNIKKAFAVMQDEFNKVTSKRRFLRVKLEREEINKVFISNSYQSPGQISTMLNSNAILEVKPYSSLKCGDIVEVILL